VILELKPEQQALLNRAAQSGMTPEDLLDQAFAVIEEQHLNQGWLLAEKHRIAAQIEEGFAQSERGELVDGDEAIKILEKRPGQRRIA
jgi:predicted transcriptional regulator